MKGVTQFFSLSFLSSNFSIVLSHSIFFDYSIVAVNVFDRDKKMLKINSSWMWWNSGYESIGTVIAILIAIGKEFVIETS